jgi:CDK inhibitor PHO81
MVPALIDAIKSQGLVLVTDKSGELGHDTPDHDADMTASPAKSIPKLRDGIDGVLGAGGVLWFKDCNNDA